MVIVAYISCFNKGISKTHCFIKHDHLRNCDKCVSQRYSFVLENKCVHVRIPQIGFLSGLKIAKMLILLYFKLELTFPSTVSC